jgi:hypothetical protein
MSPVPLNASKRSEAKYLFGYDFFFHNSENSIIQEQLKGLCPILQKKMFPKMKIIDNLIST